VSHWVSLVGGEETDRVAPEALVDKVAEGLSSSFDRTRRLPSHERARILDQIASNLAAQDETLVRSLVEESELAFRDMTVEVERTIDLFRLGADQARLGLQEGINLDAVPAGENHLGMVLRVPIGPVLGMTPFNGPILTGAHKIAPAIATGAPIVIKPSDHVARSALVVAEAALEAGWPAEAIAVLPTRNAGTRKMILDERIPVISFTGGSFGWDLKKLAPTKHIHIELGGNGAVVVASDADLAYAAHRCAIGGFVRSGQSCLAVQRIYVEANVYATFVDLLKDEVEKLVAGDPADPLTHVGPMVNEAAAIRVEQWVREAIREGARLIVGGSREGRLMLPTLLADVTQRMKVVSREVFGPTLAVAQVKSLAEGVSLVNDSDFGLSAGVFTSNIQKGLWAFHHLEAGAVIINDINSWRVENMPHGGVKKSGLGREGIRYAMLEMTQPKLLAVNAPEAL
jgi:acyl-CoA reductase-like NAD-dependent aldehyde dehydrogenase